MRLLLESHIAGEVTQQLRQRGIDAVTLQEWRGGSLRSAADNEVLAAAAEEGRVLVTYDLRTLRPLVTLWAEIGQSHAGVVFIDDKTMQPGDVGRLVRALVLLVDRFGADDWIDRTDYLHATE
ncbi:MAG: DUF5615 family PIN-like protein [Chloroflexi bacterium]|nr:DUF5615 family PIN-like protein [Chloroflexota bacterium]